MDADEIIRRGIAAHLTAVAAVRDKLAPDIAGLAERAVACLRGGHKILLCGNGGSASDAQHLATELVGRFVAERPGLAAVALTADTSALTAISNDYGFERVFARQVQALGRPGDLLIAISTSGDSPNVVAAAIEARALGIATVGLLGRSGGKLRGLVDLAVVVPGEETARIQEAHILIGHLMCALIDAAMFGR